MEPELKFQRQSQSNSLSNMQTVAILEDNPQMIADIGRALENSNNFRIVITADRTLDAIQRFPSHRPDVVLVDLMLRGGDSGADCIRELRTSLRRSALIVLTVVPDAEMLFQCFRRGASGYAVKSDFFDDPVATIKRISRGEITMTPSVRRRMEQWVAELPGELWTSLLAPGEEPLTGKERRIMAMLARGLGNREIDGLLGLGKDTTRKAMGEIHQKIGATNRAEALVFLLDALYEIRLRDGQ